MPDELSDAIPILREESHFLLVNKPAGLFSQASPGIDSLETRLMLQLKNRDQHPGQPFIGLPHRLDRGTSGVMLIAKNQRALKRFGAQFQSRKVNKYYLAVVQRVAGWQQTRQESSMGSPTDWPWLWEDHVRKVRDQARAEVVPAESAGAKYARSSLGCLGKVGDLALLLLQLETGRMHQIRLQAASRGMPLLGDINYGATLPFPPVIRLPTSESHPPVALHALRIEFRHPQSARMLSATAEVPSSWRALPSEFVSRFISLTERSRGEADTSWSWPTLKELRFVP